MTEYVLSWPKSESETYVARLTQLGWVSCRNLLEDGEPFKEVMVGVTLIMPGCSLAVRKAPIAKVLDDIEKKGGVVSQKGFYVKKNRAVREPGEGEWLS